jgi:hypothetical protein
LPKFITPTLNASLSKYIKQENSLRNVVSERLTMTDKNISEKQVKWDIDLENMMFPFWRVYSGYAYDSGISSTERPGITINLSTFDNTQIHEENISVQILNAESQWIANPNSFAYIPEKREEPSIIKVELFIENLSIDKPTLFLIDIEREIGNLNQSYSFTRFTNYKWIDDWSLDLKIYRDEAYRLSENDEYVFILNSTPNKANSDYSQADKTPFLNNLFDRLLNIRTKYIQDTIEEEEIAYTEHIYSIFGFVVRDKYTKYEANAKPEEDGGFAFSVNDINDIS